MQAILATFTHPRTHSLAHSHITDMKQGSSAATSAGSDVPPLSHSPTQSSPSSSDKRTKKRAMIINEIMSSEAEYLNRLLTLKSVYLVPIREGHILTTAEYAGQFWQLESIYDLHVKLFEELSDDFNQGGLHVGKIFQDFSHFLKMYQQYLSCFAGGGMVKRAKLLTSNKKFSDFMIAARKDPRCNGNIHITSSNFVFL